MSSIYVFSGPCGCGKTTLTDAYARCLVNEGGNKQVYVIHGDDFHRGLIETDRRVGSAGPKFLYWQDVLKLIWDCLLSVVQKALDRKLDVVIDYVVEDELPLLIELAKRYDAKLFYVVLTTSQTELRERLIRRGSDHLIDRSLILKSKLEKASENQDHLYDICGKTIEQEVLDLDMAEYEISLH